MKIGPTEKLPSEENLKTPESGVISEPSQTEFRDKFGRGEPRADLEKLASEPKREKVIQESRQERQAPMAAAVKWIDEKYAAIVPEKMRGGVETVLTLVPFYSAVCDMAKGEAAKEQAAMDAGKSLRKLDLDELGKQAINYFKGTMQENWGMLQGVADFFAFGEADAAKEAVLGAVKGLKGSEIIEKAGPAMVRAAESVAEKSPGAAKVMKGVGEWFEKTMASHPEMTRKAADWVDGKLAPAKDKFVQGFKNANSRKELWRGA